MRQSAERARRSIDTLQPDPLQDISHQFRKSSRLPATTLLQSGRMETTTTFFAGEAEGYETQMGRWSRRLSPLLIGFAKVDAGSVLDVGCGTGTLTLALSGNPRFDA